MIHLKPEGPAGAGQRPSRLDSDINWHSSESLPDSAQRSRPQAAAAATAASMFDSADSVCVTRVVTVGPNVVNSELRLALLPALSSVTRQGGCCSAATDDYDSHGQPARALRASCWPGPLGTIETQ